MGLYTENQFVQYTLSRWWVINWGAKTSEHVNKWWHQSELTLVTKSSWGIEQLASSSLASSLGKASHCKCVSTSLGVDVRPVHIPAWQFLHFNYNRLFALFLEKHDSMNSTACLAYNLFNIPSPSWHISNECSDYHVSTTCGMPWPPPSSLHLVLDSWGSASMVQNCHCLLGGGNWTNWWLLHAVEFLTCPLMLTQLA